MTADRRLGLLAVLVTSALLMAPASSASERPPTPIGVRGAEFSLVFTSGRTRFAPGPAEIDFYNAGADAHDLKVRRVGAEDVVYEMGSVASKESGVLPIPRLKPGATYYLWCSLQDGAHEAAGMAANLTVKKKRKHRHHRG